MYILTIFIYRKFGSVRGTRRYTASHGDRPAIRTRHAPFYILGKFHCVNASRYALL